MFAVALAVAVMFVGWRILFPGENPPLTSGPVEASIGADGGELRISDAARIEFPAGAFPSDTVVTATPVADPDPIDPADPAAYPLAGQAYDITLSQPLQHSVTIVISYAGANLPASTEPPDYKIVEYHAGEWYALPTLVYPDAKELRAETDRFSTIVAVLGVIGVGLVGYALASLAAREDPKYLQPDMLNASWENFHIDTAGLAPSVKIGKDARLWDRSVKLPFTEGKGEVPLFPTYASEMEADPNGMCIDFAPYLASLFIAQGYRTRVVTGSTFQPRTENGQGVGEWVGHMWVEVLIGDTPYYVNTAPTQDEIRSQNDPLWRDGQSFQLVPAGVGFELIPLDLLTAHNIVLKPGRMFWKDLKNDWTGYETYVARFYDKDWWKQYVSSVTPQPSQAPATTPTQTSAANKIDIYLPEPPQGWGSFDSPSIHTERNDQRVAEASAKVIEATDPVASSGWLTVTAGINDDPRFKPTPSYTPLGDTDYHTFEGGHLTIGGLEGAYVIDRTKYDNPLPDAGYNPHYDAVVTGHDGVWIHIEGQYTATGPNSDASARQEAIIADFRQIVEKLDVRLGN